MNKKEREYVQSVVENEGFDYAFRSYTSFENEVNDKVFHILREAYVSAAKALADYAELD